MDVAIFSNIKGPEAVSGKIGELTDPGNLPYAPCFLNSLSVKK